MNIDKAATINHSCGFVVYAGQGLRPKLPYVFFQTIFTFLPDKNTFLLRVP